MYLGIDMGTSGIKAILINDDQTIIGSAHAKLTVQRPHIGWSEQDPKEWITALDQCMHALKEAAPNALAKVQGIGLSGHMHGATLLDKDGSFLRPCLLWNDTRAHEEAHILDTNIAFRAISGNIVFPGFTAPKVLWVAENEPDVFAQCAKVLLPKDYLRFYLTGDYVSDLSDASGTSWLDVRSRAWSDDLLSAVGLSVDHMPDLVEGNEESGHLKPELATRWGIKGTPVVAGGAGDNAATAIGSGVIKNGQGFLSLGTSGVLFTATDSYSAAPETAVHSFCHAIPNTWHHMGVILSAVDALNWHAGIMGSSAPDLVEELGSELRAPTSVRFLPYLSGERTPHNDAHVRGSFHGLSHSTTRPDLTQAVLEGVAFALLDNKRALSNAGSTITSLIAMGGGSNSDYWLALIATVLNTEIHRPESGDLGASLGAARLGMLAHTGDPIDTVCTTPSISKTFEPNNKYSDAFTAAYDDFKSLYRE